MNAAIGPRDNLYLQWLSPGYSIRANAWFVLRQNKYIFLDGWCYVCGGLGSKVTRCSVVMRKKMPSLHATSHLTIDCIDMHTF